MDKKPPELPHDLGLEQAVLGTIIQNNGTLEYLDDLLPEHFYSSAHRKAFIALGREIEAGGVADAALIRNLFINDPMVATYEAAVQMPMTEYVDRLVEHTATFEYVLRYAKKITALAKARQAIAISEELNRLARSTDPDMVLEEALQDVGEKLYQLETTGLGTRQAVSIDEAIENALNMDRSTGIPTMFPKLNELIGGLQPGALYIIGARTAVGKSALAINIADHLTRNGTGVTFYSFEMGDETIAERILSAHSWVPAAAINKRTWNASEVREVHDAQRRIKGTPLRIERASGYDISQLSKKARGDVQRRGTGVLIIDYLQLVKGARRKGYGSRENEVAEIARGLKVLSGNLSVPVIALSQVGREVTKRDNQRPRLSDLRESGSIEQDADVVMLLHRAEMGLWDQKPDESDEKFTEWHTKWREVVGKAELIVAKNRHGPTGDVALRYDKPTMTFTQENSDDKQSSQDNRAGPGQEGPQGQKKQLGTVYSAQTRGG